MSNIYKVLGIPAIHKHYVGSAHSFEILNTDESRPNVTILKTFFIDDTVNANDWQATWEGLKQDAEELLGIPLVLKEDLEHPKFSVQKFFDRGTIFDYDIDEENHKIIVYARITDSTIVERIKSGELEYVSPAVIPRGSEYMKNVGGVDVLGRTLPLHLAIVRDPAYGIDKAKMSELCSGDGRECLHRLKMMKVATTFTGEDCVSRKIKILKNERPTISNEQAAAIAYSMCREGTASNGDGGNGGNGDGGSPNSGIKSRLRILNASADKLQSVFDQIKTGSDSPMFQGNKGVWIQAKGMDVFVAQQQSLKDALLAQCGCAKLGSQGKISKEKADYHKTDSTEKNCHTCRFFHQDTDYCEVVEGNIEPYFVSDLWQPKT